jgi:hypothetical protein
MTWAAYRGPPPSPATELSLPIARAPTTAEMTAVAGQARRMTSAVQAGQLRTGTLPAINELEGQDTTGQPWLPSPIPDNPLIGGMATMAAGCPGQEPEGQPDWWYCEETGQIRPGSTQSGKE